MGGLQSQQLKAPLSPASFQLDVGCCQAHGGWTLQCMKVPVDFFFLKWAFNVFFFLWEVEQFKDDSFEIAVNILYALLGSKEMVFNNDRRKKVIN